MAQQMGREEKRETINISSSTSDARGVQVFILKLKIQDLAFSKKCPHQINQWTFNVSAIVSAHMIV